MQNSSEFQYIVIDTIHESATNPRRTFDEAKLAELAESIRTNGLIQSADGYAAPQLHTHAVIFNVTERESGPGKLTRSAVA